MKQKLVSRNAVSATTAFWLAIVGLYFIAVAATAFVITAVLGNREIQYDAINRIGSTDCILSVPPATRTQSIIDECHNKFGITPAEAK